MHSQKPNREQRDLSWSITSPALVDESGETFPDNDWFASQVIQPLELAPPPTRFRLGIHFERIFQTWLNHHPTYKLLAANLQIRSPERTLGEFDLLVDTGAKTEHWELAVKFYINVSHPEDAYQWFGPDPKDTLGGKLNRLTTHQLKLGQLPASQTLLAERKLNIDQVRCIVKGRLYVAFDDFKQKRAIAMPGIVNPDCTKGWWLSTDELEKLHGARIAYIEKRYWLSEITPNDHLELLSLSELKTFLADTRQIAPQFVLLTEQGHELSRGFILKPQWFELAGL